MQPRSPYHRHLLTLVAVQMGCLALGLWIHYRQVVSAVYRTAEEQALAGLTAGTNELLTAVGRLEPPDVAAGSASWEKVRHLFPLQRTLPGLQVDVVDPQWRVLAQLPTPHHDSPPSKSPPSESPPSKSPPSKSETLTWAVPPKNLDRNAESIRGLLVQPDGRHVALARRLGKHGDYLVAHYPLAQVNMTPAALLTALPAAGAITWVWVSALLLIAVYMIVIRFCDGLTKKHARAETTALTRTQSLLRTREAVIFGLARLAESRDRVTGSHLERISAYASRLARAAQHHARYADLITAEFVQLIGTSSALHDIGKVGIEDAILFKPGALTKDEHQRVKQHTTIGEACLLEIERRLGTSNFLQMARQIARLHHERWDGQGYPDGLAGEQVPLAARIVAIADVYEALSSRRVYKEAFSHQQCVRMIRDQAGKQFDPDLVEVFAEVEGAFRQIACQFRDEAPPSRQCVPERIPLWEDQLYDELATAAAGCEDWSVPIGSASQ
ncbi:MAG: hypothetical protein A2V70_16505 [Planctomycetes bacterium RBG_13_63_9]|nr:MAG: hypothetical protein A2V70_16505 [Planctomycetes bacterium RBG_13_63_9]